MCENILAFVCLVALVCDASAAVAPYIQKCKSSDSKCAKASGQAVMPKFAAGIPELGIERLDPLHYERIDASTKDLKLILNNIDIIGVKNCEIKNINRDVAQSKITISGLCTMNLEGDYEVDGKLFVLPIRGKGKVHAKLNKIFLEVVANMADREKNGKKYWDIKSWSHTYELKDKSEIVLENLFEGNEVLASAVTDLLKNSANEVIGEIGGPIIKALLTKVVKNIDKFARKVPAEELAIDP